MGEFKMPSLGADMEVGTLLLWKVRPGDRVQRGDIIAEVATDKGDIEVEVFEDGVVKELLVEAGAEVPVGTVLAVIGEDGVSTPPPPERGKVSPLARRLASERGVDLHALQGTGSGGAITQTDVERAASPAPRPAEGVRLAIAAAMARANREIPHYYLETHIDMKPALDWLSAENRELPLEKRLLPIALLLRAVARSVEDAPAVNGYWVDDGLEASSKVHIGLAIALRAGGLVTPALHDVGSRSVPEIMAGVNDLVGRARAGRLRSSELSDATITVTNLGDLGVETVHGVIYPPQVALVGFGKIVERPWAENGLLGVRPVLSATLAGDHRATDGRTGAQFLDALARHLRKPEGL